MRPKIVFLILVVAIGVVAFAAILKGVVGWHSPENPRVPQQSQEETSNTNIVIPQVSLGSSNSVVAVEQLRSAELAKGLDDVRELQAQGDGDPSTVEVLLSYVMHRESEVRRVAVQALVQLNATNAIPGLEQALGRTEDPHDKIALLEAINYLKLPEESTRPPWVKPPGPDDQVPPPDEFVPAQKRDPSAPRPTRERKVRARRGGSPPVAPGTQPVPVPGAAPSQ